MTVEEINGFIENQKKEWPVAGKGFAALDGVEVKTFYVDGVPVKVQFNPARAVSSGAKVDKATISARPCFLCAKNRDSLQKNIPWKDGQYEILLNPFPIFPRHLTVPATSHTLQSIEGRIAHMFELAGELPGFTVFYNGPRCGASAPDHMHFQAGDSDFLPVWQWLIDERLEEIATTGKSVLKVSKNLPMKVYVIDAVDATEAEKLFEKVLSILPPTKESGEEAMMNVLAQRLDGITRFVVIPRRRHRPSFYDAETEEGMMISPASVDLGGVFILPRKIDFDRIDAAKIKEVYNEVTFQ